MGNREKLATQETKKNKAKTQHNVWWTIRKQDMISPTKTQHNVWWTIRKQDMISPTNKASWYKTDAYFIVCFFDLRLLITPQTASNFSYYYSFMKKYIL